jgi:transcriptional regulator with XRE-family HTH domain
MIGSKIRLIRLARGLSQEEVANSLNIQQNAYSKLENGGNKIDDEKIERLAKIFGVSVEDIKSPEPVLLSFNNCNNSGVYNNNQLVYNQLNENLIKSLQEQLIVKDLQIEKLLNILSIKQT